MKYQINNKYWNWEWNQLPSEDRLDEADSILYDKHEEVETKKCYYRNADATIPVRSKWYQKRDETDYYGLTIFSIRKWARNIVIEKRSEMNWQEYPFRISMAYNGVGIISLQTPILLEEYNNITSHLIELLGSRALVYPASIFIRYPINVNLYYVGTRVPLFEVKSSFKMSYPYFNGNSIV